MDMFAPNMNVMGCMNFWGLRIELAIEVLPYVRGSVVLDMEFDERERLRPR